ncbi:cyclin-domain-containing protein [Entophlyctis helioformis]|nr:cyclin-domain-containing protein [Entophlyctis helioformis]
MLQRAQAAVAAASSSDGSLAGSGAAGGSRGGAGGAGGAGVDDAPAGARPQQQGQQQQQQQGQQLVLLPSRDYNDCPTDILIQLTSAMLNKLIVHNDLIPVTADSLTRFHSRSPPAISVHDYLMRIVRYASVERAALLLMLVYIDRICARLTTFTMSSLTAHRFIIAATVAGSKCISDQYCTNSFYGKVGGIALEEMNVLELELCKTMNWELACSEQTLQTYFVNLVRTNETLNLAFASDLGSSPHPPNDSNNGDSTNHTNNANNSTGKSSSDYKNGSNSNSNANDHGNGNSNSNGSSHHSQAQQKPKSKQASTPPSSRSNRSSVSGPLKSGSSAWSSSSMSSSSSTSTSMPSSSDDNLSIGSSPNVRLAAPGTAASLQRRANDVD